MPRKPRQKPAQRIVIDQLASDQFGSMFTVRIGNRYQDHLCRDEAFYCVARLMVAREDPAKVLFTREQQQEYRRQLTGKARQGKATA